MNRKAAKFVFIEMKVPFISLAVDPIFHRSLSTIMLNEVHNLLLCYQVPLCYKKALSLT